MSNVLIHNRAKSHFFSGRRALVAALLIGCTPVAAFAQDSTQAPASDDVATESSGVGEIIVTAQKRSESVNKVGMSISAFDGNALQKLGVTSTEDLVKIVPGFSFGKTQYATPVYTLRGVGYYDNALAGSPTVSVYADEVPLPYTQITAGANFDIQRVEVLKGPQGTLFGSNATGGAINYVAAKPTGEFAAGADLSYGRFNAFEGSFFVSGPVSDTLRARAAVKVEQGGAWQVSQSNPSDRLGDVDRLYGRLLLDWMPSDRLSFILNVNGWRDRSDSQAGQFVQTSFAVPPFADPALAAWPAPSRNNRIADWDKDQNFASNNRFWQIALRSTFEASDALKLIAITSYTDYTPRTKTDMDGTSLFNFRFTQTGKIENLFQELRAEIKPADGLNLLVGANYQSDRILDNGYTEVNISSYRAALGTGVGDGNARNTTKIENYAVFGNVEYQITPEIKLIGGMRYTNSRNDTASCTYDGVYGTTNLLQSFLLQTPIQPGGCITGVPSATSPTGFAPGVVNLQVHEDNISWRVGANWQATPNALLYANVSRGYKAGGVPQLFAFRSTQLVPVTQESLLAYEIGAKLSLLNRRVQLNAAAFYYDYADKQVKSRVPVPPIGNVEAAINIPKSRIKGAELQLIVAPVDGLTFSGGVSYLDSRIANGATGFDAFGNPADFSGERFPFTSKWQVNGDVSYDTGITDSLNGFIGASVWYQSATNSGLGDLAVQALEGYALVDLRFGVRHPDDKWRVSGFIRNLTDKDYRLVVTPVADDVIAYTGRPRTYGIAVSYRY